jgi:endonuclease/exonuclease/phosphatase family metal-dependent hydrolase
MTIRIARRALLSLALLAAVLVAVVATSTHVANAAAEQGPPDRDIRLFNYNIAHARGLDGDVSVHRIAHVIGQTGADVVTLQEVDNNWSTRSDFRDQASEIAELLDMDVFFAPIYSFPPEYDPEAPDGEVPGREGNREYGLAIFSSHPIISAENHQIQRFARRGEPPFEPKPWPGFPEVELNVRGTSVRVFATHLQSGMADVRADQVDDMLAIIGDDPVRTILAGDLNEERDWPEQSIAPLFEVFDDVWDLAGEGPGYTFRADDPSRRIDFVLTSPDIAVRSATVVESDASDHLGVLTDLRVSR